MWLWRDWVINAFNTNLPYDRVPPRATRRRPDAEPHRRPAHRHRLPAQQHEHARRRHDPRREPHQLQRRPRENARRSGARPHARLLPVPQPQVRSAHAEGLLPDLRVLQHAQRRRPRRRRRHQLASRSSTPEPCCKPARSQALASKSTTLHRQARATRRDAARTHGKTTQRATASAPRQGLRSCTPSKLLKVSTPNTRRRLRHRAGRASSTSAGPRPRRLRRLDAPAANRASPSPAFASSSIPTPRSRRRLGLRSGRSRARARTRREKPTQTPAESLDQGHASSSPPSRASADAVARRPGQSAPSACRSPTSPPTPGSSNYPARRRPRHPQRKRLVPGPRARWPRAPHRHIRQADRHAETTPFLTVQLNFGHGNSLVAARFEFLAMTGTDDGSDAARATSISILQTGRPTSARPPTEAGTPRRTSPPTPTPRSAIRIALANLEERLDVLTQKFPTMVMDVAAQAARDAHPQSRRLLPADRESHRRHARRPAAAPGRRARQPPRPRPVDHDARASAHRPRRSESPLANASSAPASSPPPPTSARRANTPATPNCSIGSPSISWTTAGT